MTNRNSPIALHRDFWALAKADMHPRWADGNTSPTRKRGVGTISRLRVGLVLKPLVQLLAAILSGHTQGVADCQQKIKVNLIPWLVSPSFHNLANHAPPVRLP